MNISVVGELDNLEFLKDPLKFLSGREFDIIARRSFRALPIEFHNLAIEDGEILEDFFKDVNLTKYHNTKSMDEYEGNVRDEGKVFLFRMDQNQVEFRNELQSEAFADLVEDTTIIGSSVYVELFNKRLKQNFFRRLNSDGHSVSRRGVKKTIGCSYVNCLFPPVNPINFVPLFKKSNYLKLETYLSIRHLDYNDFKYKGFVEFEVLLDLPI